MTGCQRTWHRGVHTCIIPPMVLLPQLSSVSSHGGHSVCYLMASTGQDIYPSAKCMLSCRHPCLLHVTWSLHPSSVDVLVDVHGRSHSFPLIHPREVFLAWHWMTSRPLSSHGIISLSIPLGVGLAGVGLVHLSHTWQTPIHKGIPASDMTRWSQLWCRMCDCPHWLVTSYKGMSVAIWHTTSWNLSSHLSLIFPFSLEGIGLD